MVLTRNSLSAFQFSIHVVWWSYKEVDEAIGN